MRMLVKHRLEELFSSSISNGGFFVSSHALRLSTIAAFKQDKAPKPQLLVDFLIDSIGFTREEAITASSKVPCLKSTANPQSVLNIFKQYGLDQIQIKQIISSVPKILNCNSKKTLEPKFRALREYGFSGSDLTDLLKANPNLIAVGLHTRIIPVIEFIRRFVGSNEEAIGAVKKSKWLFARVCLKKLSANVLQLQTRGLSYDQIVKLITQYPRSATSDPLVFNDRLVWIVEELGIPENSPMFIHAIYATTRLKMSSIEKKLKIFGSYEWSEEEIATFGRSNPFNLALSEAKIHEGLNFFMKELGYTPAYLAIRMFLLRCSLEKTVKPRYKILEILKEKKLVGSKPHLASLVNYSDLKFLKFLKRFENELPDLVEIYTNSLEEGKPKRVLL